jgi:TolB protein
VSCITLRSGVGIGHETGGPAVTSRKRRPPDGKWIVFASSRMGFKDEALNTDSPQPYGEIFLMRYDGTHVQQLTDNQWEEGTPAWLPWNKATR